MAVGRFLGVEGGPGRWPGLGANSAGSSAIVSAGPQMQRSSFCFSMRPRMEFVGFLGGGKGGGNLRAI